MPETITTTKAPSVADPGPLGLAAFAATTFMLSIFNSGLVDSRVEAVILGTALFYGGIAQLIAGAFEFVKNNLFGALAFTSYGAFWMAFWFLSSHPDLISSDVGTLKATGVGIFLLAFTIFTAYMTIAAFKINRGLFITFALLVLALICLTIGDLAHLTIATRIGGVLGLGTALAAWYCSAAGVLAFTFGRTVLPLGVVKK